jgi:transcriptional regulator with XRE-family HTH domain
MDGRQFGPLFRSVRRRRGLRQIDVARMAGVTDSTISALERGSWRSVTVETLQRLAAVLDIHIRMEVWWRGGEGDRLVNRAHSHLAESVARFLGELPGWIVAPEVSFSIRGERGFIDQLGWHARERNVLVVELKTELVDVNELLGTLDRKVRLARQIAVERGWLAERVSCWLVIPDTDTNRRHVAQHRALLRARLPEDGRRFRSFLRTPDSSTFGIVFWPYSAGTGVRHGGAAPLGSSMRGTSRIRPALAGDMALFDVADQHAGQNGVHAVVPPRGKVIKRG